MSHIPHLSHTHTRSIFLVRFFPQGAQHLTEAPLAFATLALLGVATSFSSTLMFTAIGSFYNKCAV